MTIQQLLEEYDLSLDDVRWFLSRQEAERLLSYRKDTENLAREIWAGRLEAGLYNMEERHVAELAERLEAHLTSEQRVREHLGEIRAAKRARQG